MDTDPEIIRINVQWCDVAMQCDIAETRAHKLTRRYYVAPELADRYMAEKAAASVNLALACIREASR